MAIIPPDKKKINCPFCGYVFTDTDMEKSKHDLWAIAPNEEEVHGEPCPQCGNEFYIQGGYTPEYETAKSNWEI